MVNCTDILNNNKSMGIMDIIFGILKAGGQFCDDEINDVDYIIIPLNCSSIFDFIDYLLDKFFIKYDKLQKVLSDAHNSKEENDDDDDIECYFEINEIKEKVNELNDYINALHDKFVTHKWIYDCLINEKIITLRENASYYIDIKYSLLDMFKLIYMKSYGCLGKINNYIIDQSVFAIVARFDKYYLLWYYNGKFKLQKNIKKIVSQQNKLMFNQNEVNEDILNLVQSPIKKLLHLKYVRYPLDEQVIGRLQYYKKWDHDEYGLYQFSLTEKAHIYRNMIQILSLKINYYMEHLQKIVDYIRKQGYPFDLNQSHKPFD